MGKEGRGIASLDLKFLILELKDALIGGKFRKIYQYGSKVKQFLFEIWTPGKGESLLYVNQDKIFLTEHKKLAPSMPPNFCMFLRKHLLGKKIMNIRQHAFDRIIEVLTTENVLIFEFLKPGNVILCDASYNIIMPLEIQKWRDREIRPKIPYKYPPAMSNPFELDINDLIRLAKRSDKVTGSFLATTLGFGPIYGEEICTRATVNKNKPVAELVLAEMSKMYNVITSIRKTKPVIYDDFIALWPMEIYKTKPFRYADNLSKALDTYYSEQMVEVEHKEAAKVEEKKEEKIERIVEQQKKAGEKWERIALESKDAAEAIYKNYQIVEAALEGIRKALDLGMNWDEIKKRTKAEDTPEAEAIKEIRENDAIIILDLGGKEVEIDIRKTVEENAAKYFEDAKWAKKKLEGLKKAKAEVGEKIEEVEEVPEKVPEIEVKRKRRKWYEKFKWFISTEGFLVVAGRSAVQNETLVNKHMESTDLVLHADIHGAAFVIIKSEGKNIPDQTKKEAADFGVASSKAWAKGLGKMDIFCVTPEQVSKTSGLPKGAFEIRGPREWFRNLELKLSIGVKIEPEQAKVVYGPVMAVRKGSDYFVTVKPGFKKVPENAREIRRRILIKAKPEDKFKIEQIKIEDFEAAIPAGMSGIVELA